MAKIMSNFRKDVACRFSSLLEHLRVSGFHILISSYNNEDHDCPCMKSSIRCLLWYQWVLLVKWLQKQLELLDTNLAHQTRFFYFSCWVMWSKWISTHLSFNPFRQKGKPWSYRRLQVLRKMWAGKWRNWSISLLVHSYTKGIKMKWKATWPLRHDTNFCYQLNHFWISLLSHVLFLCIANMRS